MLAERVPTPALLLERRDAVTALLLAEMLSGAIVDGLRARGIDAVAVVEDDALVATPDEDLLALAATQVGVLVTVYVGDSPRSPAIGVRRAGCTRARLRE